ncbi:cupin domain-containing protein [Rhodobacteraceae bacterium]|nr:cupin domain-containing protein [Paracoccaceae bacterium]
MNFEEAWEQVLPQKEDMGVRLWGKEEILAVATGQVMMKKLFVRAGSKGGLQYHRKRVEAGYVLSGKMIVRLGINGNIEEKVLEAGDHFIFPTGLIHQEEALEDTVIIECSTPWINDRVRVEGEFGLGAPEGLPSTKPGEEILR